VALLATGAPAAGARVSSWYLHLFLSGRAGPPAHTPASWAPGHNARRARGEEASGCVCGGPPSRVTFLLGAI